MTVGYSSNITVINNDITDSSGRGFGGGGNKASFVYHNNFINNSDQAEDTSGLECRWDNGYPSGGNYWSDYAGIDEKNGLLQDKNGGDGIGDTSYVVSSVNEDRFPLMKPFTLNEGATSLDIWLVIILLIMSLVQNSFTPSLLGPI